MKNLISKKLALLAIVLFASIGHAFGQSIDLTLLGIDNSNTLYADVAFNSSQTYSDIPYWLSGEGQVNFATGEDVTMQVYTYRGLCSIASITVDGVNRTNEIINNNNTYVFSNISANHTVVIEFEKNESNKINVDINLQDVAYLYIDYNNEYSLSVYSSESLVFPSGGEVTMSLNILSSAYQLNKVLVDDEDVTNQINNGQYVFSNLSADHNVSVILDKLENTNSISVSFNEGSSTSYYFEENGNTWWNPQNAEFATGNDVKLFIHPSFGMIVNKMLVTNTSTNTQTDVTESYQANGYYEFSNLSADYAVEVELEDVGVSKINVDYDSSKAYANFWIYYANPESGNSYGINANGNEFTKGSNVRLTVYPNDGYALESILVDNIDVTSIYKDNNYYEFSNLNADHTVKVNFKESIPVTISYSFNRQDLVDVYVRWPNGSCTVSSNSSINVPEGSDVSMSNNWINGSYQVKSFKVGDVDYTESFISGDISLSNVTSDLSVYVELETTYPSNAIDVSFNEEGIGNVCISGSNMNRCVSYGNIIDAPTGDNIWVSVNLFSSAHPLKSITIDGTDVTNDFLNNSYSFPNNSSDHSIYVEFDEVESDTITVSLQNGDADIYFEDGDITVWGQEALFAKGHSVKMYINPYAGYEISKVLIKEGSNSQDVTSAFQANGYYEFLSLSKDYSVEVVFTTVPTHTIKVNYDNSLGWANLNNSWIDRENGNKFNVGSTVRLRAGGYEGYMVESIYVGTNDVTASFKANGYYDIVVNSDINITINFAVARYYTISVTGDFEYGSYWLSDSNPIEGSDVQMEVYPNEGYVAIVKEGGNKLTTTFVPSGSTGYYTYVFKDIQASHDVEVVFGETNTTKITFAYNSSQIESVIVNNYMGVSPNGYTNVTKGTTAILKVMPKIGYEVESVKAGNTDITNSLDEEGYYRFGVYEECTVTITMKKKTTTAPVPFTLSELGEGTFCCEYDLNFRNVSGIKAYVASGFDPTNSQLVLTRVDEAPAGTGLLIKGTSGEYSIPTTNSNFLFANMLKGIVKNTYIQASEGYNGWYGYCDYTNYIFGTDGQFRRTNGEDLPANSAYLMIPSMFVENSSLAKIGLIFLDDEEEVGGITTGVGFIWAGANRTVSTDDAIYNLQGQKVNEKSLKPGIYIKNGKKFMVK